MEHPLGFVLGAAWTGRVSAVGRARAEPAVSSGRLDTRVGVGRARRAPVITCQGADKEPNYNAKGGFDPAEDADYVEVRIYTVGPHDDQGSCMISLKPVCKDAKHALRMHVMTSQAEAMQASLDRGKRKQHMQKLAQFYEGSNPALSPSQSSSEENSAMYPQSLPYMQAHPSGPGVGPLGSQQTSYNSTFGRPSTHDLFHMILDSQLILVTKVAITHIANDVYVARVWVRTAGSAETSMDARPSDAITLALNSMAPIYLNKYLLGRNGTEITAVQRDVRRGFALEIRYENEVKTTSSLAVELKDAPEQIELSKLKMRLDMAVRLERFHEAAHLYKRIQKLCPLEVLNEQLQDAISRNDFQLASRLRDEIYEWRLRLIRWELGE
ncbi:hypothetical protein FVE85_1792 [Porphyridium purpureum]|uniref:BFN domain-containing protein n=1 Tax=Porphyridium purpureum TaxID=35688 RepID=A0A5J4YYU7_PORPP|nr:hypothetical protein FVE85_1792 [Porphyridium purpureum]|eukprot:POR3539..scf209_3